MQQQVVSQQPTTQVVQMVTTANPLQPRGVPREWNSGIFECFSDIPVCLLGLFCSPCYQCCVAQDMGEHCCVPICVPASIIPMRAQVRARHNIRGSLMDDCCMSCFCGTCVLCQLSREIKAVKSGQAQA